MSNGISIAAENDIDDRSENARGGRLNRLREAIDRSPLPAFLALTTLYVVTVVCLSHYKLLWLDELITLHIARLGSAVDIWHALARGADPNPPVTHLLVHFCREVFGERELALRLPAIVGYWVGLLSLFLFLLRRIPATWALAGTLLVMTMASFDYSYESRSYGIFHGLTMLAFFLWSRSVDPVDTDRSRQLYLAGMTLTLAACISTNYFAVLAFLPIAAGQMAYDIRRWWASRTLKAGDLQVYLCLVIAATPLIVYRPLIAHSIAQFAPHAWNKVSIYQVRDSYTQMVEVVLYPIGALFAVALAVTLANYVAGGLRRVCGEQMKPAWLARFVFGPQERFPLRFHEAVGVLFLMAYPLLGYIMASIRGGMLSPRFVIPVCFGFAIAAVTVAFVLFGARRLAGLFLLFLCTAWFMCREGYVGYWYSEQKECFYKVVDHLPEALKLLPPNAPIAVPDPLLALTFQHYAPREFARREVFPIDFPALRNYRHDDSPEQNIWAGRNTIYTLPVMTMARFQRSAGEYLIIAGDDNWFLDDLHDHGYEVTRLPINTRAGAIGGFTPLARGVPIFYLASGDRGPESDWKFDVIEFNEEDNLPDSDPAQTAKHRQQQAHEVSR